MNKKILLYIILVVFLLLGVVIFFIYNHISKVEQDSAGILSNKAKEVRDEILQGPYGQMSPEELVEATIEIKSRETELALVIRKDEVLPVIKEKLQIGSLNEKHDLLSLIQNRLRWPEMVPYVEPMVRDESLPEQIRGRAAIALAVFQHHESIHDIRHLLTTSENVVARLLAARTLAMFNDSVSESQFESMLNDPSPFIQVTAAMCLGMLGSDVGLETAINLSNDDYFDMRRRAAEALSYINTPEALERLRQMKENDPSISDDCAIYLKEIELSAMQREDALKELELILSPDNPGYPRWAFIYLIDHFGIEGVHILKKLSENPGPLQEVATIRLIEINSGTVTFPETRRRDR